MGLEPTTFCLGSRLARRSARHPSPTTPRVYHNGRRNATALAGARISTECAQVIPKPLDSLLNLCIMVASTVVGPQREQDEQPHRLPVHGRTWPWRGQASKQPWSYS